MRKRLLGVALLIVLIPCVALAFLSFPTRPRSTNRKNAIMVTQFLVMKSKDPVHFSSI